MGISISTLKNKLEGWISPEEFEADRTREYKRLNERFESWKRGDLIFAEAQMRRLAKRDAEIWLQEEEAKIREDAVKRSLAITRGKVTEQLAPLLPNFPFEPKDCRFLGNPVDLIVFDGMSEGTPRSIIIVEIKTGNSQLSVRERQIRDLIKEGKVEWKTINL